MGMLAGFARDGLPGVERGAHGRHGRDDGRPPVRRGRRLPARATPPERDDRRGRSDRAHLGVPLLAAVSRANGFEMFNDWVEPTQIMEAGGKFVASPPRTSSHADDHPIWAMAAAAQRDTCGWTPALNEGSDMELGGKFWLLFIGGAIACAVRGTPGVPADRERVGPLGFLRDVPLPVRDLPRRRLDHRPAKQETLRRAR